MLDLDDLARRLAIYRANGLLEAHEEGVGRFVLGYGVPLATDPKPKTRGPDELFPSSVHPLDLIDLPPALPREEGE